ncbi:5-azacytidine-induced protein 1 [Dufourea novaeangliae]|uniref:5-azacytidine-induced protein 1 n=1 Tax=Dufourea novaeangliae TaxID=178035 RepID=A0A154PBM8_DUFNO|nr:5-azacytidine-induced protein 1 [Dufourea novaeangliae]
MINIRHPMIHSKPPMMKPLPARDVNSKQKELTRKMENDATIAKTADHNQNIVDESDLYFEQLCDMISILEKNITGDLPEVDEPQLKPEKDDSREKGSNRTTYDDIMSFLAKLEEGSLDETRASVPEVDQEVLQEIFMKSHSLNYTSCDGLVPMKVTNHAFEEDLATARLQLEEKNATITLLKEQLRSERQLACEKLESQRRGNLSKLQSQDEKYKGIVKRHQKFIEQLIEEKTDLTEKCNSLAQRVKDIEMKMQRDLRAAADRHLVELQRAKEHYAAAEKIKRERWVEARTTKIKEMTVKGLEPELRSMMEQHAEEMQSLRNAHMKELQDAELRVIRRSNQQLEQLRLELTASHERMLANEKNILWARYNEKLEEQNAEIETKLQRMYQQYQVLISDPSRKDFQEEMQALKQHQLNEKRTLQESLKTEWEAWIADYKRQQTLKFERAESKIRDESNKERDRQIELAIERLEKDSREARLGLQQNFDCKLRSLKEKFDMELQTAVDNEQLHKDRLTQAKDKLDRSETQLQKVEKKLHQCTNDLNCANEVIKRLSLEKDNARKLARQEIEGEKRELEEKIGSLYHEIGQNNASREASMAQLHSRIKLVMTQKVLTIKNLAKELGEVKSKCEHLEKLVDQQRREYILKSL